MAKHLCESLISKFIVLSTMRPPYSGIRPSRHYFPKGKPTRLSTQHPSTYGMAPTRAPIARLSAHTKYTPPVFGYLWPGTSTRVLVVYPTSMQHHPPTISPTCAANHSKIGPTSGTKLPLMTLHTHRLSFTHQTL